MIFIWNIQDEAKTLRVRYYSELFAILYIVTRLMVKLGNITALGCFYIYNAGKMKTWIEFIYSVS